MLGLNLIVFTYSTENHPSLLEFYHSQVSGNQKPTLTFNALRQSSHWVGAKEGLGSGFQPLSNLSACSQSNPWSVQRTATLAPGPFSTLCCSLLPSFQLRLRSNRGQDCPNPLFLGSACRVWCGSWGQETRAEPPTTTTDWPHGQDQATVLWASGHLAANGNKKIHLSRLLRELNPVQ